jgi:DNA-binding protein HU-beta
MSRNGMELRFSSPAVERARARMHERDRARHDGATGRVVGNRVDLVVPLDEFNAGPVMIKETLPTAWVSELVKDNGEVHWSAIGPADIEVGLEVESAFVRMQGEAHFSLQHLCVRCGQRDVSFEVPLVIDLRLVERAPDKEINADYEQFDDGDDHAGLPLGDAADLEDIDIASYTGNSVDVGAVLREQLFLELPAHPNCESPGSTLGEPCLRSTDKLAVEKEHELPIDPRWAGLLAVKARLDETTPAKPTSTKKAKVAAPAAVAAVTVPAKPAAKEATSTTSAAPKAASTKPVKAATKKAAASKKPAKKAASKKPAKKAASKKPAKKVASKKPAKKAASKKPAKKAASKKPAKKAASQKPTKKAAAKKPAKKAASKKPAKKAASKKPAKKVAKKATVRK